MNHATKIGGSVLKISARVTLAPAAVLCKDWHMLASVSTKSRCGCSTASRAARPRSAASAGAPQKTSLDEARLLDLDVEDLIRELDVLLDLLRRLLLCRLFFRLFRLRRLLFSTCSSSDSGIL